MLAMSLGWSPTGTFVNPGKSTSVSVRTLGSKMHKLMGGLWRNARVASRIGLCITDNLGMNIVKVLKLFIREMEEFAQFVLVHS